MTLFHNQFRVGTARRTGWDYGARGWYFVTICTKGKKCTLADAVRGKIQLSRVGRIAETKMHELPKHYVNVSVDSFVIMPNHVHAIVVLEGQHSLSPATKDGTGPVSTGRTSIKLGDVVGGFKASVSRESRANGISDFAWQGRFYDRILRSNISIGAVRDYIAHNPQNWLKDPDR
jgi:putative transposase